MIIEVRRRGGLIILYSLSRESFVKKLLRNEAFWIHANELDEAHKLKEEVVKYKSLLGFVINEYFDILMDMNGKKGFDSFYKLVLQEVVEEFRPFMVLLYDKKSIDKELIHYIIENYDVGGGENEIFNAKLR